MGLALGRGTGSCRIFLYSPPTPLKQVLSPHHLLVGEMPLSLLATHAARTTHLSKLPGNRVRFYGARSTGGVQQPRDNRSDIYRLEHRNRAQRPPAASAPGIHRRSCDNLHVTILYVSAALWLDTPLNKRLQRESRKFSLHGAARSLSRRQRLELLQFLRLGCGQLFLLALQLRDPRLRDNSERKAQIRGRSSTSDAAWSASACLAASALCAAFFSCHFRARACCP